MSYLRINLATACDTVYRDSITNLISGVGCLAIAKLEKLEHDSAAVAKLSGFTGPFSVEVIESQV
jgi:hypothetical protein